jgi:6-phosphogluconolactonase (cycloisomerase 2 family)
MTHPGPNAAQDMPHPHEVILDPTGSYIVVPDLGADKLRVFSIEKPSGNLVERQAFSTPPGTGPRHGAFRMDDYNTFLFLVSELGNRVTSYVVFSDEKALYFTEAYEDNIYNNMISPADSAAAEGLLSASTP